MQTKRGLEGFLNLGGSFHLPPPIPINLRQDVIDLHRLREVAIKPCLIGFLLVLWLTPSGDGANDDTPASGGGTDLTANLVPVHVGHTDVEKDYFRVKDLDTFKRGLSVMRHAHFVTLLL